MSIELKSLVEVVEKSYTPYYNIYKENLPNGLPAIFCGTYYGKGQKSIFPNVGDVNIEYLYVFSQRRFDDAVVKSCIDFAMSDALARVKPDKNLRSANINVLFISNGYTEEAEELIKKSRFVKKYPDAFGAKSVLIVSAADANLEKTFSNNAGDDMKLFFKGLFKAQWHGE